ncbi:hypothetical protein OSB04_024169 [Centaurea solstitialis]|uniref:Uncharacterized protein n=1 Tax=Centaurea solstitialis TaxID=347529 RepID=A0AA38W0D3_9ASTR|nr:hypothetical protein OSB04_024169 [Centaurea solstitialis]
MGTRLQFCTAFHPHLDGQNERMSQTLEIILRVYVLGVGDSWDTYLPLAGFRASLAIMPVGQRELGSTEIVRKTKESIEMIRERLWTAQRRQKSCTDKQRSGLEFNVGVDVLLKKIEKGLRALCHLVKLVMISTVRSAFDHRGSIVVAFLTQGSSGLDKGRGTGLKLRSTTWLNTLFDLIRSILFNSQNLHSGISSDPNLSLQMFLKSIKIFLKDNIQIHRGLSSVSNAELP